MNDHGRRMGDEPAGPAFTGGQPVVLMFHRFDAATVTAARQALAAQVSAAGLVGDQAGDFVLAVHELVTNAVRHGGGSGHLELRRLDDVLTCEVTDHGRGIEEMPIRMAARNVPGGRGLWLARRLTSTLMFTSRADGLTASVSVYLT